MSERALCAERVLCAERLFDATLPGAWAPILDGLAQLYQLKRDDVLPFEERCKLGATLFRQLLADSRLLVEPTPSALEVSGEHFRSWFSEAVLLWTRLSETGSRPIVDTMDTRTLDNFPLDLPNDDGAIARVKDALMASQSWQPVAFARVERRIAQVTSNLDIKHAIVAVLVGMYNKNGDPTPQNCVALMQAVYGPTPWRAGDVDLIITSTTVFFCIRRQGERLAEKDWEERPADERQAIADFLRTLKKDNVPETKRFPAFGTFDFALLDDSLVNILQQGLTARGLRPSREVIIHTLATMVSILTTDEVEMYLVHDTWGHTWQEALSEFEWEYALLPKLAESFSPDDGPALAGEDAPTLRAAFVVKDGATVLDEDNLMRFATCDLGMRIQLGISSVLAEMLADFMEAKYARLCPDSAMPTSSLIEVTALKLDLSLSDMRRQLRRVRKRYRRLAKDEGERKQLTAALAETGLPTAGLSEAVARAGALMWARFGPRLDYGLEAEAVEGALKSTVYRRIMLKFLLLVAELDRSLDALGARTEPPWRHPASCPDLMAVSVAHFYERNRQREFWALDQVMRTELPLALGALRAALRDAAAEGGPPPQEALDPAARADKDAGMLSEELSTMFTDIPMSADDAEAIVAALRDVAETDGVHDEELALINEFVAALDADLGEREPTELPKMTPTLLAATLTDPALRLIAVQSAVLIAMADGDVSDKERAKCKEYADALGVSGGQYAKIEAAIVEWVKAGDMATIMN